MTGKAISRYKVLEKLGEGEMGEVYLAEDNELSRRVVLNFLPARYASDEGLRTRFKREAQAAAALNHPNVITIHEVSEYKNRPFIAMEYVEGESLKSLIAKRELPQEKAIDIAVQVCEGLAKAHQMGIVHRDLKPQNILMGKDGQVRILDFGLAKVKKDAIPTQLATSGDTVAYMSPEQARGEDLDHRTDIWSLGVILYEMLTGEAPFKGEHDQAVIYSILNVEPQPLTGSAVDLQRVVNKALAKNQKERYQAVGDLLDDLRLTREGRESGSVRTPSIEARLSPSIAVLPFTNLSTDKDQEYFCDGMADEIISALTHVEGLRVVARTSSFLFRGQDRDLREIGRRLNVGALLEGSVQKVGTKLRIAAQLVKVADGYDLWSERYDRNIEKECCPEDIFSIQEGISLAIVEKLKVKLLGEEKEKLLKRHTQDLDAYNLYLKGRFFWNKRTEQGYQKGLKYFRQAIERDPSYALAHAGIADCYDLLGFYGHMAPKEAFPKAKAAAEKALQIDEGLAEAHTSLAGASEFYDWDWPTAEKEYKRAIQLNPNHATAHHWYAEYLSHMGRHEESMAEAKRALELAPLSLIINTLLGLMLYETRQYDRAVEQLQKTLEMDPGFIVARFFLAPAYAERGMYDQAVAEAEKTMDLSGGNDPLMLALLGAMYSYSGKRDEAKRVLADLDRVSKQKYVSAFHLALIHMGLGEKDQAFACLERAYEERDHWLESIKVHPMLDSLRSDPRFTELLKKMRLDE
jgi:serine/threonine-protein kinase